MHKFRFARSKGGLDRHRMEFRPWGRIRCLAIRRDLVLASIPQSRNRFRPPRCQSSHTVKRAKRLRVSSNLGRLTLAKERDVAQRGITLSKNMPRFAVQ